MRGCGIRRDLCEQVRELQIDTLAEPVLENLATQGDSPVGESVVRLPVGFPSTTGHVKPCGKLGGPSSKAKYYSSTDSEPVP